MALFLVRLLCALCAAFLLTTAASARDTAPCLASGLTLSDLDAASVAGPGHVFDCDAELSLTAKTTAFRFTLAEGASPPRFLEAQTGRFAALHLAVLDRDGAMRLRSYDEGDARIGERRNSFMVALPPIERDSTHAVAIFERPRTVPMLASVALVDEPASGGGFELELLFVAMVVGFLLAPIVFDIAFYRTLRERFALWHAALAGALAFHISLGGLLPKFLLLPMPRLHDLAHVSFSVCVVAACMFAHGFIEREALHPRLRSALEWAAVAALALATVRVVPLEATRAIATTVYFFGYFPILALLIVVMVDAWRRGSRAARFLAIGWTPFLALGAVRITSYAITLTLPDATIWLMRVGAMWEILVTGLGVADRVLRIKRQRDEARREASALSGLANTDALTGLWNRHALNDRFASLRSSGYRTLALLDLDRFKNVNDGFGHAVGDDVLRALARRLRHADGGRCEAFRIGGEEFVLLLAGPRAAERAEALRRAIPGAIAEAVPNLDRPITASMGVVDHPDADPDAPPVRFASLYARADELLYEAKRLGRNRSLAERVTGFQNGALEARPSTLGGRTGDRRASS